MYLQGMGVSLQGLMLGAPLLASLVRDPLQTTLRETVWYQRGWRQVWVFLSQWMLQLCLQMAASSQALVQYLLWIEHVVKTGLVLYTHEHTNHMVLK